MKCRFLLSLLLAGWGAFSFPANPLTPFSSADPTFWRAPDGSWRASSTGQRILKSRDFFTWEDTGRRLFTQADEQRIRAEWHQIWAPDVTRINGLYYLYVTHIRNAAESAIYVYTSRSAEGPFTDGRLLTCSRDTGIIDTIDPEVVRDENKRLWLFFGSIGRIHRVRLASDGKSIAKGAKYEVVAGLHVKDSPSRLRVFEGAYLYRRGGWWYLFASRGRYADWSYGIVVGRAKKLTDDFRDRRGRLMKNGFGTLILSSNKGDKFFGPGHNGEIAILNGRSYLPYHCHVEGPDAHARPLFVQELIWGRDGWPSIPGGKPR